MLFLPPYLTKDVLSVGMPSFIKKIKEDSGRIIELENFKTYKLCYPNLWSVHKLILKLMCPKMRHDHDAYLLTKRSIWVCNIPLKYGFVIMNGSTPYIIVNDVLLDPFGDCYEQEL